ncbi:MAG: hypothetical protein J7647_11430 [Cyanobacteria bacterium SBLK]|nr:hypothetical protein [Cyanobacteria bacterium SBLK]
MTSPPRPYKSRLFNFLNRQRIVLGDRLAKTFRQAKTAAIWGAQILVYPAYLVAQAGRAFVWQLEQKVAPIPLPETGKAAREDYIPVDTPIWKTLDRVKPLLDILPGDYEIQTFAPPILWGENIPAIAPARDISPQTITADRSHRIRGIASTVDRHHLVLATVDNQSLDILTPKQQDRLQQTIRWELTDYAYQQYLQRIRARQYLIPPSLTVNPNILLPLRWFWQLMRWEQQSFIAIAIDLFEEAQIVPPWQEISPTTRKSEREREMENKAQSLSLWQPPLPVSDLVVELDEAIALLETKQDDFRDRLEIWWQESKKTDLNDRDRLAKLQFLLQAAIDYFFGSSDRNPALPAVSVEEEPWLAWEELYDRSRQKFAPAVPPPEAIVEAQMRELGVSPAMPSLSTPNSETHFSYSQKHKPMSADLDPISQNKESPKSKNELEKTAKRLPLDGNLLEVEAKSTGYVEHPLEKTLKLVDRIMAWIEDAIAAIWNFFKRTFLTRKK